MPQTESLSRRGLLQAAGAALALPAPRRAAGRPPNILFAISDDQSWLHTGAAGDPVVRTPAFDRLARGGVRFSHAFSCAPTCMASRGAILTGQDIWRLEEGANLWSTLNRKFAVYPDALEAAGYQVGFSGKGWGPGNFKDGGRTRNPAGPEFKTFQQFHAGLDPDKPFCHWLGSFRPHRPYVQDAGLKAGLRPEDVRVPAWVPDVPEARRDMLDYYLAIQSWDRELQEALALLDAAGQFENTLIIATSDNGMSWPRAKATVYDSGVRMPLAVAWPARIPGGRVVDDIVSFTDFAPTILEAAGLKAGAGMTGRSLMSVLRSGQSGRVDRARVRAFSAMERHAACRPGNLGYPMRSLRTYDYRYIWNAEPERGPAGVPQGYGFGDIDNGPTKAFVLAHRDSREWGRFFAMSCGPRPAEELYDLRKDPDQIRNVAGEPAYAAARRAMKAQMDQYLRETGDPRLTGGPLIWDTLPHYGQNRMPPA